VDILAPFVDFFTSAIVICSQAFNGQLGLAIVAITLGVKLVLFPLTLRIARLTAKHQEQMRLLKPQLDDIQRRHKHDAKRLMEETRRVYKEAGVAPVPLHGCLGALLQTPILLSMFYAVHQCATAGGRWLWIRNIAQPDLPLAIIVAGLTLFTMAVGLKPEGTGKTLMLVLPVIVTFVALIRLSAGVGLYWGASSMVSLIQAAIIRREKIIPN